MIARFGSILSTPVLYRRHIFNDLSNLQTGRLHQEKGRSHQYIALRDSDPPFIFCQSDTQEPALTRCSLSVRKSLIQFIIIGGISMNDSLHSN